MRKLIEPLELHAACLAGVQVRDEIEIKYGPDHTGPMVHIKKFVLHFLVTGVLSSS